MFDKKKLFLDKMITLLMLCIILACFAMTFFVIVVAVIRKFSSGFMSEYKWLSPGFMFIAEVVAFVIGFVARRNSKTAKKYEKAFARVPQQTSTYEISQIMQSTVEKVKNDISALIRKGYLVESYFMEQNNIFVINNGQLMIYNGNPNLVRQIQQINNQVHGFGYNTQMNQNQGQIKEKGILTKIKDWLF